jgi:predicted Zn-dependent peptidase
VLNDALPPALLVHPTRGRRTAICGVWITYGSAHEPASLAGATHLVEHLTLRRCGNHDRRTLAEIVDRLGGGVDAWTGFELMGVSVATTVDALAEGIALLTDAVLEPSFDPADVELERRVVRAELELIADDPNERVEEGLLRAAWGEHSLARPVIGSAETLDRLSCDTLRRHHESMIQPGRVLAAVVGDVEPAWAAEQLSRLPLESFPSPPELPELVWRGSRGVVPGNGNDQVHARIAFPAMRSGDPRVVELRVLNRILGFGASSRLFQRLREEEGLTYEIWSAPVLRRLGGLLEIGWTCAPTVFDEVWRMVDEEMRRFASSIGDDELEVAKEGIRRGLAIDAESPAERCAMDVAEILEHGRPFDYEKVTAEIEAVTTGRLRELAAELLQPEKMGAAVCGPSGFEVRVT